MYPTILVALWFVAGAAFLSAAYNPVTEPGFYVAVAIGAPFAWLAVVVKRHHDREERLKREAFRESFEKEVREKARRNQEIEEETERIRRRLTGTDREGSGNP